MHSLYLAFFLVCSFTMTSAQAEESIQLDTLRWSSTWDFQARNLSAADGLSSSTHFHFERTREMVFFGWLGAIQAGPGFGSPLVGFAKVFASVARPVLAFPQALEFDARTDSPGMVFDVCLKDEVLDRENARRFLDMDYTGSVEPSQNWARIRLTPRDFKVLSRGRDISGYPPVQLERLTSLSFQIRKSAQKGGNEKSKERLPFRLELKNFQLTR